MKSIVATRAGFAALFLAGTAFAAPTSTAPSERAANYEEAIARAKATGKDIAVYQFASDWNPCSLSLYQNVWSKESFLKSVGSGFILVAIDNPEVIGGRAVYGRCTAEKCGLVGFSDTPIGTAPPLRLEALAKAEPPTNQIDTVTAEGGARFVKRADGTFVVDPKGPNPAQDTLTLIVKPARPGSLLRLDFPIDDSLPNGGPGRSGNGNAVINEIELSQNGKPIVAEYAWGNPNMGNNFGPWTAIDGITEKTDEAWNLNGGQRQRRTLFVSLKTPVTAGADLKVKLISKTQWGQHVPGAVRAFVIDSPDQTADVRSVGAAQSNQFRNRQFTYAGWGKMPRLSLIDSQGRPVAANPSLNIRLTAQDFASMLKSMREKREKRDELWAKAETAEGPAKAELLRQGLDAMNVGRDPEFGRQNGWGGGGNGPYESIHQAMKAADKSDESGAIRWLGFSQGAWGGVPWQEQNQWWKKLEGKPNPTDADYAEAEQCIDRELNDPRNKLLDHDHIQHLMKAKYDLYLRQAKGDHLAEKILDIQRKIAAVDPNTFWGVGAIGYLGMYRRTENPFLTYGFDIKHQTKPGAGSWLLADAWKEVDHSGSYKLTIAHQSGKDTLKFTRVAVVLDGKEIGAGQPKPGNDVLGPECRTVEIPFTCGALPADAKCSLKVEYAGAVDKGELLGGFAIEPVLVEE